MHYKQFSQEDIASMQAACAILRRNKVCYCIEVNDDGTYILCWGKYIASTRRGRPVGS